MYIYMLKYQIYLAFQNLDTWTVPKKQKYFVPSSTIQKEEWRSLYEIDTKYKANWKLAIAWRIFYMWFPFLWKLFWKDLKITILVLLSFQISLVLHLRIGHSNLLCDCSYCIKTLSTLKVAHKAKLSPIEAIYLNAFALGQNAELQKIIFCY